MQLIHAHITDTNHRPRGMMAIHVDFHDGAPHQVTHDGKDYFFRRHGTHIATGRATVELATEADERLWITRDGQQIWED